MYISHKSNVIQQIEELEWQCRRMSKGQNKSEYWTWIASITTQDDDDRDIVTYPSEDFTIVECTDEDVNARLNQLGDYQSSSLETGTVYNIKWQDDIGNAEEILDDDGKSQSPKVYVQSHFVPDDSAKDARILANEWTRIRRERDRLLADTDWMTCSDSPTMSAGNKTYRQKLRDLPSDQKDETTYADITWPTKP